MEERERPRVCRRCGRPSTVPRRYCRQSRDTRRRRRRNRDGHRLDAAPDPRVRQELVCPVRLPDLRNRPRTDPDPWPAPVVRSLSARAAARRTANPRAPQLRRAFSQLLESQVVVRLVKPRVLQKFARRSSSWRRRSCLPTRHSCRDLRNQPLMRSAQKKRSGIGLQPAADFY